MEDAEFGLSARVSMSLAVFFTISSVRTTAVLLFVLVQELLQDPLASGDQRIYTTTRQLSIAIVRMYQMYSQNSGRGMPRPSKCAPL